MEQEHEKPFGREPWRKLLESRDDGPPELTDARIKAEARRALAPGRPRWWLPASLAASLLLAVLLVRWQFGDEYLPGVVSESDVAAPAVEAEHPRQEAENVFYDAPPPSPQVAPMESPPASADAKLKAVPSPQIDLPAAQAPVRTRESTADEPGRELREIAVTGSRRRADEVEASTPTTNVTAQEVRAERGAGLVGNLEKPTVTRSPEDWYAEILKLRAAGKKEEADRELEKLDAAYPGWLEKNHPQDR